MWVSSIWFAKGFHFQLSFFLVGIFFLIFDLKTSLMCSYKSNKFISDLSDVFNNNINIRFNIAMKKEGLE